MSTTPSPLGVVVPAMAPPPPSPPAIVPPAAPAPPVWPRSAQVASVVLVLIVTGSLSWHAYASHRRATRPTALEPGSHAFRVDLNRADRSQLMQLPGVGEALATRIEEYRTAHYAFRSVDELAEISGIGRLTVERLRHLVSVEAPDGDDERDAIRHSRSKPAHSAKKEMPAGPRQGAKKDATPPAPVDVNKATAEELQSLPGIGPTLAARIVEARKTSPFKSVDDLRRVPGIGPKTLDKLRPHVTVGEVKDDPAKKE
jgi:competence protein ComEA